MNSDPIRLLDDPASGPTLRGDLGTAANAKLTGLSVAGGLTALQAAIAAQGAQTGVVAPVAAAGMSTLAKLAVAGALLVGGVGLWVGLSGDPAPAAEPSMAQATPAEPVRAPVEAAPAATPEPPAPAVPAVAPVPAAPVPDEEPATEDPVVEAAPVAAPRAHKPKHKPAAAPLTAEDAMAEASLISRARKALATSPSQALALTNEAKRDFPRGMLLEEREAVAVQALAKLGRHDKAKRRGEQFLKRYGRGPHAAAVRTALEKSGDSVP
ncbi:MAG: hypothetical protein AAF721_19345 [Myxococcota bacterium]